MNEQQKLELLRLILDCSTGYGEHRQPLTVGLFKEILKEAIEQTERKLTNPNINGL